MASRDDNVHSGRHDDEVKVLTTQISFLEEEIAALRGRLADSPRLTHLIEERLREAEANLAALTGQNERLVAHPARGARSDRRAEGRGRPARPAAERLRRVPAAHDDGTVDVFTGGRKMRVSGQPGIDWRSLRCAAARRSCSTRR